jgi:hypothetical protein
MSASGQYVSPTFQQPQQFSLTTTLPSASSQSTANQQSSTSSTSQSPTTYYFQAMLRAYSAERVVLTNHPVQGGASISDHAYVEPAELLLDVGFSDVQASPTPNQYTGGTSQSATAFQVFQAIKNAKVPCALVTRLASYMNMVLVEISAPQNQETFAAALITLRFKQVIVGTVSTVPASSRPQLTGSTNAGVCGTQTPSNSLSGQLQNPDGTWNSNTQPSY